MNKTIDQLISRETPYEDACKLRNIEPKSIADFAFMPDDQREYLHSMHRVVTVLDAAKEGDDPMDYNNNNQYKYFPWWDMETYGDAPAGSGFSLYVVVYVGTGTGVGSRLSTLSKAKSRYIAEVMESDYRIIKKG